MRLARELVFRLKVYHFRGSWPGEHEGCGLERPSNIFWGQAQQPIAGALVLLAELKAWRRLIAGPFRKGIGESSCGMR